MSELTKLTLQMFTVLTFLCICTIIHTPLQLKTTSEKNFNDPTLPEVPVTSEIPPFLGQVLAMCHALADHYKQRLEDTCSSSLLALPDLTIPIPSDRPKSVETYTSECGQPEVRNVSLRRAKPVAEEEMFMASETATKLPVAALRTEVSGMDIDIS